MKLSKICGHKRVIPRQFKIWTRAESPSLMTSRSRRNNRISSACGIVSIFIESSFLSLPQNLSDPLDRDQNEGDLAEDSRNTLDVQNEGRLKKGDPSIVIKTREIRPRILAIHSMSKTRED